MHFLHIPAVADSPGDGLLNSNSNPCMDCPADRSPWSYHKYSRLCHEIPSVIPLGSPRTPFIQFLGLHSPSCRARAYSYHTQKAFHGTRILAAPPPPPGFTPR